MFWSIVNLVVGLVGIGWGSYRCFDEENGEKVGRDPFLMVLGGILCFLLGFAGVVNYLIAN